MLPQPLLDYVISIDPIIGLIFRARYFYKFHSI